MKTEQHYWSFKSTLLLSSHSTCRSMTSDVYIQLEFHACFYFGQQLVPRRPARGEAL